MKKFHALLLICTTLPAVASAQRGQKTETTETLPQRASTGVPGFFDTNIANKGQFAFEFPTLALDYGVTNRFTLGINGVPLFQTIISVSDKPQLSSINWYLKARYQLFSINHWSGTFTGYIFNIQDSKSDPTAVAYVQQTASSLNLSKIYEKQHFGASVAISNLNFNQKSSLPIEDSNLDLNLAIFSAWWRYQLSETFESEVLASICPYSRALGSQATGVFNISIASCYGTSKLSPLLRALFNWRASESWMWTIGYFSIPVEPKIESPYLGFNYLWQMREDK